MEPATSATSAARTTTRTTASTTTPTTTASAPEIFNAATYLVDRQLAEHAERDAVRTPDRALTYAALAADVRTVAAGLRAYGVRPEQRVFLCMTDDIELFTAILAVLYLGAVAVPASTMLTAGELATMVVDSRARVVLGSTVFADTVTAAVERAPEVERLVLTGAGWDELRAAGAEPVRPYPTWPDSPALWLYTSGTTGTPKAAMHRHADIRLVAENYGQRVLGITAGDRCLSVAKLFFAYGIGNSMFFPLSVGATALLEPSRPSPALFARRAATDRPTLLFGTPSFWGPLLAADLPRESFASVRQGVSAGEALPARMFTGMREQYGIEVLDGIGSTEMLHIYLSNRPGQVHPGSSGTPVPGYTVQIRDEQGGIIDADDQPGELYVSGGSAAIGYWCRADVSRRVFLGEWMRTGDTYVRNPDGTYTCLGRLGDMLKAGGIWVTPSEVENRLLAHPDIAEAVVVGVPDSDELDKPVACVVPVAGRAVDATEVIQFCRDGLAAFKRPRAVLTLAELPKTATGKIRRNVLRDIAKAQLLVEPTVEPVSD